MALNLGGEKKKRALPLQAVTISPQSLPQTNGVSEIAALHRRRAPAFRTFVLQLSITAI